MELSPPLLALIGTALVAIGGLLGIAINAYVKREENVYARLDRVEQKEAACQREVFNLKSDLQTTWLAIEMILLKCPEADDEISTAIDRMRDRQQAFLHREDKA